MYLTQRVIQLHPTHGSIWAEFKIWGSSHMQLKGLLPSYPESRALCHNSSPNYKTRYEMNKNNDWNRVVDVFGEVYGIHGILRHFGRTWRGGDVFKIDASVSNIHIAKAFP